MLSVNKIILIGHLGANPESSYTPNEILKSTFSLATSQKILNKKENIWEESTYWHRVVAWAKTAELCANYLKKGDLVYIEGKIRPYEYTKKKCTCKIKTYELVADKLIMLSSKTKESSAVKIKPSDSTVPF